MEIYEKMKKIYKEDPDKFEKIRNEIITKFISESKNKQKLEKIQWKINIYYRF